MLRPLIDQYSPQMWDAGHRVLQGFRLAASERDHVAELLGYMQPDEGAHVLDIGCGFGEVARLMAEMRPDLRWTLLNFSGVQLRYVPATMRRVQADMHALPFAGPTFDCAMFCWSLCNGRLEPALAEAARVTRPGGVLFVFDFERLAGSNDLMQRALMASAHPPSRLDTACQGCGWQVEEIVRPAADDTLMRSLQGPSYDQVFRWVRPLVLRARRQWEK